jgi:hypothetical protein
MHAVFIEVNADESHVEAARESLRSRAVPMARDTGARAGFWLAPSGGRGVSVVVFDDEAAANAVASRFRVGEPPMSDAPAGVTVKTVEVREVLAAL